MGVEATENPESLNEYLTSYSNVRVVPVSANIDFGQMIANSPPLVLDRANINPV